MKSFKQFLTEEPVDKRPVKFIIGDGITKLGQLMEMFPTLNEIIKSLAIDDDWTLSEFNVVKSLSVSQQALRGEFNKLDVLKECKTNVISAVLHFTTIDLDDMENDTIKFIPKSIHEWHMILHVHSNVYVISTDDTVNEVEKLMASDKHTWSHIVRKLTSAQHIIHSFVDDIHHVGRKIAFGNIFSDMGALIPFL